MKKIFSPTLLLSLLFVLNSCGTTPHRMDPTGNQGITTTHDLNFKDWQMAAEKCVNSLLTSGVLDKADGRKSILMVSTVRNSTSQHIDVQLLTHKIRTALLRSGKAVTTTAVGAQGPEDRSTRQARQLQDDEMFDQRTVKKMGTAIAPDYSLAGEVIQVRTRQGRMTESYFMIHMTLTDHTTGLALWEDEVEIAKQEKRPFLGL